MWSLCGFFGGELRHVPSESRPPGHCGLMALQMMYKPVLEAFLITLCQPHSGKRKSFNFSFFSIENVRGKCPHHVAPACRAAIAQCLPQHPALIHTTGATSAPGGAAVIQLGMNSSLGDRSCWINSLSPRSSPKLCLVNSSLLRGVTGSLWRREHP